MDLKNSLLAKLAEMFNDPISQELFNFPRLLGKHTFSSNTLMHLTKFIDPDGNKYIYHPFTREKFYFNAIEELPKNTVIEILLLIFLYCKQNKINDHELQKIFTYFIKIYLYNIYLLQCAADCININFHTDDLVFKELLEIFGLTKFGSELLTKQVDLELANALQDRPADHHLNKILFLSIKYNNYDLTNLLFLEDLNIDLNLKDRKGKTALFWACYHHQTLIAKTLVKRGADLYTRDQYNKPPFAYTDYKKTQIFLAELKGQLVDPDLNLQEVYNLKEHLFWSYQPKKLKKIDPLTKWQIVGKKRKNFLKNSY